MRTLLCPGDKITYTCALVSTNAGTVNTLWSGSGFTCTGVANANAIILTQGVGSSLNPTVVSCGNLSAVMTNVSGTCYTSVLTIPTPQYYNGVTVQCKEGTNLGLIGNDTLNVKLACKLDNYIIINMYFMIVGKALPSENGSCIGLYHSKKVT